MMRIGFLSLLGLAAVVAACGSGSGNTLSSDDGGTGDDGGGSSSGSSGGGSSGGAPSCTPCSGSSDCSGGDVCAVFSAGKYCFPLCGSGGSCGGADACVNALVAGVSQSVCAPRGGVCMVASDGGGSGSGSGGSSGSGSSSGGGDSGTVSGTVGANGGTLSKLYFAVAGDTRPPNEDDLSGYPTSIITKIYDDIEALSPRPAFVVSTGDYQFASTGSSSTASQQISLYMGARAHYTGTWFPAMGNHECTGADDSNCTGSSANTANYNAFMKDMLGPISKTTPYYSINVNAIDGSWTSKFVFVAANAWDSTQQSWLQTTMAQKTTYTFVIRHEPTADTGNPAGAAASDTVISGYPYTLLIVGHSHTYGHYSSPPREVILGNGGAPLSSSSKNYGYGIFTQQSDGTIIGDEVDYMSGAKDSYFHFQIAADGTLK